MTQSKRLTRILVIMVLGVMLIAAGCSPAADTGDTAPSGTEATDDNNEGSQSEEPGDGGSETEQPDDSGEAASEAKYQFVGAGLDLDPSDGMMAEGDFKGIIDGGSGCIPNIDTYYKGQEGGHIVFGWHIRSAGGEALSEEEINALKPVVQIMTADGESMVTEVAMRYGIHPPVQDVPEDQLPMDQRKSYWTAAYWFSEDTPTGDFTYKIVIPDKDVEFAPENNTFTIREGTPSSESE